MPDADDERSEWDEDQLAAEEQAEVEAMTIAAEAGGKRDAAAQRNWRRGLAQPTAG